MIVNAQGLTALFSGYKTLYQDGFAGVTPQWEQVATQVPSNTREEKYGWLGSLPMLREWIGDRQVRNIAAATYAIRNKDWEMTVSVQRNDIEDDTYGVYAPVFRELGGAAARHPDQLVFGLLAAGFTTACYDGKPFFAADHPVGAGTAGNLQPGAGNPWFLLDTSRAVKPIIFQKRQEYQLQARQSVDDENVFWRKEYLYGVDARNNVGFGFWQMAFGSKDDLDEGNYETARAAMGAFTDDHGNPLGVKPTLLVVGPSNEGAGKRIIEASALANGATNVWQGTTKLMVIPWLP